MSYVALYRKYRPKRFCDVVGQDTIVEILKNSIINNHISHAYLFTGPRGTGKTSIAKILAHAVNCNNFVNDVCENCQVCKYLEENDSDIIEIDAASNNGVDEIRTLRENVKIMPSFCKYKIYIIDEVHMLSTGAFNALLKTLEEPPEHVIFILATTEPNKIPITIMSRCQRFDFQFISNDDIKYKLNEICDVEKIKLSNDVIDYISKVSDGGLRDAINLLDQVVSLNKGENTTVKDVEKVNGKISINTIINIYKAILSNDYISLFQITDSFINEGKNFKDIVNMLLTILRDLTIIRDIKDYFDKEYYEKLISLNFPTDKILVVSNLLNELLIELKYSNNESLIFQIYLFNLINVCCDKKLNNTLDSVVNKKNDSDSNINIKNNDNIVDTVKETSINNQINKIRINNCLALANKETLNYLVNNFDKINDYSSNRKYNNVVEILNNSKLIVASDEYLMFEFTNETELMLFNNLIEDIERFLNVVFDKLYKVVALTSEDWLQIKNQYVQNKKNNIKYSIIDENIVKLDKKETGRLKDKSASDIFGDKTVSVK